MVSYYRDQVNPEAVHFPAKLHVAAARVLVLIALTVPLILTLIYSNGSEVWTNLAAVMACAAVVVLHYPRRITTDEAGVHRGGLLGLRRRSIPWNEIDSIRERALVPGLPAFSIGLVANWVIVIRSVRGTRPIRFTCNHSGRRAFLQTLKRWGAPAPVLKNPPDRNL